MTSVNELEMPRKMLSCFGNLCDSYSEEHNGGIINQVFCSPEEYADKCIIRMVSYAADEIIAMGKISKHLLSTFLAYCALQRFPLVWLRKIKIQCVRSRKTSRKLST